MGTENDGFQTQVLDANEFRHSAFSRAVSAVRTFEVREGMEGGTMEHIPETDLTICLQDLEEGVSFDRLLATSSLKVHIQFR